MEALQQLLQHESRGEHFVPLFEGAIEQSDFGDLGRMIAAERERPHAGVDEEPQRRVRSRL